MHLAFSRVGGNDLLFSTETDMIRTLSPLLKQYLPGNESDDAYTKRAPPVRARLFCRKWIFADVSKLVPVRDGDYAAATDGAAPDSTLQREF